MSKDMTSTITRPRFASQWLENDLSNGQVFTEPSCTVPDQSLTIPEIIAKFTRSGLAPASIRMADKGGNIAADPESDPLDDYYDIQAAAAAARAADPQPEAVSEPVPADSPAPAQAGA